MPVTAHDLADIAADRLTRLGQDIAHAATCTHMHVASTIAASRTEAVGALDRLGDRLTYGGIDREMARTHANLVAVGNATECKRMADYWRTFAEK